MGWKARVVLASEEYEYFASAPPHDPERADRLRDQLGLGDYERVGPSNLETGVHASDRQLFIGAYPRGVVICHVDAPTSFLDDPPVVGDGPLSSLRDTLLGMYPSGEVLAVHALSVVDFWFFCLFRKGRAVRRAGGSYDKLFVNEGEPLEAEADVLATCPMVRVAEEGLGEDLTLDVFMSLFGDAENEIDLELALTEYARPGFFKSLRRRMGLP